MNILRLSLFKLKKNKKEAVAIAFLTMITTLMLSVFAANISKANRAYFDSFAQAGSKDTCVMIRKDKFRDEYRNLLEDDYGITDITEAEAIYASALDYKKNDGEDRTYESYFVTEKNERKIEDFVRLISSLTRDKKSSNTRSGFPCISRSARAVSRAIP